MKYIKIFLASSIVELEKERLQISDFIRSLNDSYVRYGIYFELIICENISNALSQERKQEEYNSIISNSQFFYVLFGRKVGNYTVEEFDVALKHFKLSGSPKIYTYFRQLPDDTEPTKEIKDFMERLDSALGHYYSVFSDIDAVKLNILLELSRSESVGGTVLVEDGFAKVNGEPVLSIEEIPGYRKNEQLCTILQEKKVLEEEYAELIKLQVGNNESEFIRKLILENTQKRNQLLERQHKIEEELLQFYACLSEKRQLGKRINWREKKAIELLDLGEYEGAKTILRDSQWKKEIVRSEIVVDNQMQFIIEYISGKRTLIRTIHATGVNAEAEAEIIACYEDIVTLAEKYGVEMQTLYEYASFLMHHNDHSKAIELSDRLERYYAYVQNDGAERADNQYLLACMLYKTNKLDKAEELHRKALALREVLCDQRFPNSVAKCAISYNQLGYFLFRTGRLSEANAMYQKGLVLLEGVVSTNPEYLQNLALLLNNLGVLMQSTREYETAIRYSEQSMKLRRKIAENNSTSAFGFLAMSCLNYAKLLTQIGDHQKADAYYVEAIDLYAQLCQRDTKFKVDHAIGLFYRATALEQTEPDAAIQLHEEALEQRLDLAGFNREALKADIAMSYYSLGRLHSKKDPLKARSYLSHAMQLWQELYEKAPDKYCKEYNMCKEYIHTI